MINNFKTTYGRDLFYLMAGDLIGKGMSRKVYEFLPDKKLVLKVEISGNNFQNVREWGIWNELSRWNPMSKWFAPCEDISPNGIYLLQRKVQQIPQEEYPKQVPVFFTDIKYSNFGIIYEKGKKRFVCYDYGTFEVTRGYNKKLKNVKWDY